VVTTLQVQSALLYPSGQAQEVVLIPFTQVPPFLQGLFLEQGSISFSQFVPLYPVGQVQDELEQLSTQAPPFTQGLDEAQGGEY